MENTIFNVYVELVNKKQFNKLIDACKEKGLNTDEYDDRLYFHSNNTKTFSDWLKPISTYTKVTESEFIDLLKKHKL